MKTSVRSGSSVMGQFGILIGSPVSFKNINDSLTQNISVRAHGKTT